MFSGILKVKAGLILVMMMFTSCVLDENEIYFPLENGVIWTNYQDTGIANSSSSVIKDNGVYKMWSFDEGSNTEFYYQESSDGVNWSSSVIVLTYLDDPYGPSFITHPWVIKEGTLYKMWYSSVPAGWVTSDIVYCESSDGQNWTGFRKVLDSDVSILGISSPKYSTPCVIKVDGKYKMWFIGEAIDGANIIYAESVDGINWNKFIFSVKKASFGANDEFSAFKPCIIRDSTLYKIWYTGKDSTNKSIIYAESNNGITWNNFKLSMDVPTSSAVVINDRGVGRIWYYNEGTFTIWHAESR